MNMKSKICAVFCCYLMILLSGLDFQVNPRLGLLKTSVWDFIEQVFNRLNHSFFRHLTNGIKAWKLWTMLLVECWDMVSYWSIWDWVCRCCSHCWIRAVIKVIEVRKYHLHLKCLKFSLVACARTQNWRTAVRNVVAFWPGLTMVLHEYGTPTVHFCLIQFNVLVTMDSQLNVWRGLLMVCSYFYNVKQIKYSLLLLKYI